MYLVQAGNCCRSHSIRRTFHDEPSCLAASHMRGCLRALRSLAQNARRGDASRMRRWMVFVCVGCLVLLPGVFTLQTIPTPVAVSTVAPITLEAKILHASPQSGTHGLSSGASLCNHPASWVYQPSRTAAISVGVTQNRALSSVGGGHVVSYRTLGQDWILNILVETEKVFVVTVNQHSGYVVSVDDS